jgi:hypothetical protein
VLELERKYSTVSKIFDDVLNCKQE